MRFRGKSIRRKIVALLLVPLVTLTAIWGFATVVTGREALQLLGLAKAVDQMTYPIEDTAHAMQRERRQTLIYLADPRASDVEWQMRRSRTATNTAVAKMQEIAKDDDVRDGMTKDAKERLATLTHSLEGLVTLRQRVDGGSVDGLTVLDLYDDLVDPCYELLVSMQGVNDVDLSKQGQAVISLGRARELLAREDAVVSAALVANHLNQSEIRLISDLGAQRSLLYATNLPLLPDHDAAPFNRYWTAQGTKPLRTVEDALAKAVPGTPRAVDKGTWNTIATKALLDLGDMDNTAVDHYQDRVRPVSVGVLMRAGVAGVLGLVALLFSLIVSIRIGRSLIRDLHQLRTEAHEASGVRLPGVMRRLASGEQVDVETEAPRLDYDKNEIGQVGQALNTLQRAAVEAAVRQAEMRRGVSEVFVNLARRSQVLLHKQLTLLDSMERRTEDTDELADLFRLDHLTTRMRRHAEGLVILSGAAPSRQWRKPVQLMDVVRASVAEVEDYERVEVRRLPRLAVIGPAVADLTHLIAELLENATVFSPPHTAVQVIGERVANGFTLEIHDRGLGMAPDVLLDANLRLAETPEFELSDTDRLGLFVVSRLAQRQNVRVSLQQSPYGGTSAIVFIPDSLLTDSWDVTRDDPALFVEDSGGAPLEAPVGSKPLRRKSVRDADLLDGPVELEAPVPASGGKAELAGFPGTLDDEDGEHGGMFHRRRPGARPSGEQHQQASDTREPRGEATRPGGPDRPGGPVPLPRRTTPKLVSSHGHPVTPSRPRENDTPQQHHAASTQEAGVQSDLPRRRRPAQAALPQRDQPSGSTPLPRRVRQASLAPQLKSGPERRTERQVDEDTGGAPVERDAEEVRRRMASMQRGWRRGREENTAGEDGSTSSAQGTGSEDRAQGPSPESTAPETSPKGTAQGTTSEGDGR
ncbi:sensor histidine kinase [Streptomyces odontomachi]|uniref:sensor histidine kinase n=1 Tax=Streptomyces odontomachi TaxID=2944940 RepID=UPI00210A6A71|nr:nitrate- and nitrite sensing domain-containing protein [Streptomyces sp. ODS25]